MATHDYLVANGSGAAVRQDLNNALSAIVTNNSSATQPATTYAYMWWVDTTAGQLKQRNAANSDWIVVRELDGTLLMEDGTAATPGLAFSSDVDTGLFRAGANQLGIATNGVERVEFGTSEVVFNDSGADVDFRVEGDTDPNLLYVDAGNNRVGIGTGTPGTLLELGSDEPYLTLRNTTHEDIDGGRASRIDFQGERSGGELSALARIQVSHWSTGDDDKGRLSFQTNDGSGLSQRLGIIGDGSILIHQSTGANPGFGNTNVGAAFQNDGANGSVLFVSRAVSAAASFNINADGAVVNFARSGTSVGSISVTTTNTSFNTSSDYRLKENVVDLDGAIDRVKQLAPKRFNFIVDPTVIVDGFLAHEAQAVVPGSVTGTQDAVDDDGNPVYQGIDQSKLMPLLTAALKEAISKIETLEAKVAALEAG